jgi:DNA-directed RNA polymerase subunit alpha
MNAGLREFVKPKKLECVEVSDDNTYAKFVAEPLERGFGVTLGNTLRRYLLSSISGTAIVAVKVNGIHHEFSTLPNVYEDVSDIILNLKEVVIAQQGEEPAILTIDEKGKKEITGADIKCPPGISIVNPTVHIASLMDKKAEFKAELFTRAGRGYITSEDVKVSDSDIAIIPIDSNFSPVRKVNFAIEKTRVGGSADFDKLVLEIWTNGTIDPETAISDVARVQRDQLQLFVNMGEEDEAPKQEVKTEHKRPLVNLNRSVEELELSVRSYNCLQKANIKTIRELVSKTDGEMLKTRNFGRKSLNEIKAILSEMGLSLGMGEDEIRQIDAEQ